MIKIANKAREFDKIAREVFAPAYPIIAKQILEKTQIKQGYCLDIGCGSGYLGLNIAQKSNLYVYAMDNDPQALEILKENIQQLGLGARVEALSGNVHNIPLENDRVQLIISRGSMFSWEEPLSAFNEVYRVLAPNGKGYIGGGFATAEIKKQIDEEMLKRNPNWLVHQNKKIGPKQPAKWRETMLETNIPEFDIIHNPVEMWIVFEKERDLLWKRF